MKLTYRPCPSCGTTYALPDSARYCYWCQNGYAAALRDAVEAVKAMNGWEESGSDYPPFTAVDRDDAVVAIEALGGKR